MRFVLLLWFFQFVSSAFALALISTASASSEADHLYVGRQDGYIETSASFDVGVPTDSVVATMTDFERLPLWNQSIVSNTVSANSNGSIRVSSILRECAAFICKMVSLVEDVQFVSANEIQAKVVPGASDFSSGNSRWTFEDTGNGTRVRYESRLRPNFWIPPGFTGGVMTNSLRRQIDAARKTILIDHCRATGCVGVPDSLDELAIKKFGDGVNE